MKLTGIRIRNHARLQDCDLEVREHLVLVGANDVGKSSLLRCMDLVLGTTAAQLYPRITAEDIRDQDAPFSVEVTLGELTLVEKAAFPDEVLLDLATGVETLTVRLEVTADAVDAAERRDDDDRALRAGQAPSYF